MQLGHSEVIKKSLLNQCIVDQKNLAKLPKKSKWFKLGSIGMGFPSPVARRLLRLGYLERQTPDHASTSLYQYRMTQKGKKFLELSLY